LAFIGFAFSTNLRFSARNAENWLCLARFDHPGPSDFLLASDFQGSSGLCRKERAGLALIGFASSPDPRLQAKNAGNWVCFARLMTPRRAVSTRRLSLCDWVLGNAQVGLNWVRWGTFSCGTRRPDQILAALYAMLNCGLYSVFIIHTRTLGVKPNPRHFPL
jgi:hypothetical protein